MSLTYAELSRRVSALVLNRDGEWAGLPMPIPDFELSIAPGHPWTDRIRALEAAMRPPACAPDAADDDIDDKAIVRNSWWSTRLRRSIWIIQDGNGKVHGGPIGPHDYSRRATMLINTIGVGNSAWSLETELTAIDKLAELLRPHLYEMYVLTGTFLETSPRSGVTYLFRRLRPTLALRPAANGNMRVLCALCLHPIAYYQETHAGGMCPTDDVMAHLLLMRGDEAMFWRRANQHQPDRPEAGL